MLGLVPGLVTDHPITDFSLLLLPATQERLNPVIELQHLLAAGDLCPIRTMWLPLILNGLDIEQRNDAEPQQKMLKLLDHLP